MNGLLERLAQLSLKKAGSLSRQGGKWAGAGLGTMIAPGIGSYLGYHGGDLVGGGIGAGLDALSGRIGEEPVNQVGQQNPERPSFGQETADNMGQHVGNQALDMLGGAGPQQDQGEFQTSPILAQLQELLDSLSPEERNKILAKYQGGM